MSRRALGGFTLIELVVTIMLFGVMVALAAPAMAGIFNRHQLDRAASQLSADVMYARMLAVRSAQPVELVLRADRYSIRRVDQTQPAKQVNLAAGYPGMQLSTDVTLPATLVFDSRGVLAQANGVSTITVRRAGRSQTLQVMATGRVHHVY